MESFPSINEPKVLNLAHYRERQRQESLSEFQRMREGVLQAIHHYFSEYRNSIISVVMSINPQVGYHEFDQLNLTHQQGNRTHRGYLQRPRLGRQREHLLTNLGYEPFRNFYIEYCFSRSANTVARTWKTDDAGDSFAVSPTFPVQSAEEMRAIMDILNTAECTRKL